MPILAEVHRTRQRTVFSPWRTRSTFEAVLAVAAVVAVASRRRSRWRPAGIQPEHRQIRAPAFQASLPQVRCPMRRRRTRPPCASSEGVWIATGSMGTPRSGHAAVRLLDGRVLVVGGADGVENDTSAELYDPTSGTWSATGSMLKPRGWLRGDVAARRQGARGGRRRPGCGQPGHGCRAVRPGNRDLERDGSAGLGWLRYGHAAARRQRAREGRRRLRAVRPRQLGPGPPHGRGPNSATATRPSCCPMARCSWRAATSPATTRRTRPSCTTPTRGPGPRSQACTPSARTSRPSCCPMARCSWWGPVGPTRSPPSCTTRRPGPGQPPGTWPSRALSTRSITLLADGTVLGTGTVGSRSDSLRRAVRPGHRVLDHHRVHAPAARRCPGHAAARRHRPRGRWRHADAAELYVPAGVSPPAGLPAAPQPTDRQLTGAWIATGSMGTPRSGHTAVRLLDGRVLVAGGSNEGESDMTSAELYDPESGTWSADRKHAQALRAASRPRCSTMAGCSWATRTTTRAATTRTSARRCTTRTAGPGPPPEGWSSGRTMLHDPDASPRRQSAR